MRRSTRNEVERLAREIARQSAREVAEELAHEAVEAARGESGELHPKGLEVVQQAAAEAATASTHGILDEHWTKIDARLGSIRNTAIDQATEAVSASMQRLLDETNQAYLKKAQEQADEIFANSVPPVVSVELRDGAPVRVAGNTHEVLPDVLLVLNARCHALLVGPAGTGKSTIAQQAAEGLGLDFHALSLGPTTPMSKIFGYYDAHGKYHDTPFRRAFEHGGLMLLDELDSGHPGLLSELNQALSLGVCAFADDMVTAHPDFRVIATGNTYGTGPDRQYTGRQALDAATLDRFVIIDVPVDERLEERVALAQAPTRRVEAREVLELVRKLRATAEEKRLPVMFSPRASIDSAKLIQAGATVEHAVQWRVLRGISAAHRSALGVDER